MNHHTQNLSGPPRVRQGQLSKWFGERVPHTFGSNLDRFDGELVLKIMKGFGRLYGTGKYFDVSIRGLDALPKGPLMLISNHSGGTTIPDVWGFGVAWYKKFG